MRNKLKKIVAAIILSVVIVLQTIMPGFSALMVSTLAAESNGYVYEGGAGTKVSDLDTSTKYSESLGDNASTEFAGRIWTDKSVYTGDVTFATYGGGTSTIKLNENKNGEDFLIAYSALATSESVSGSTQAPVDVVFVIDTSGSMTDPMSRNDSTTRIVNTVNALNNSIESLMELNEYTRIGVVAFADQSEVILPLGRYEKGTRNNVTNYFSLSNNNGTLYVHARVEGTNQTITDNRSVTGGTNIQRGIYEGMNMLATESSTTADVNGSKIQRAPSVVLLSDGAPTYSVGNTNASIFGGTTTRWWNPANNNNQGNGSSPYYGNGMKALMTGAYMKEAINRNYGVSGTKMETTMYTIGVGITNLNQNNGERNLANVTLNPEDNWDKNNTMSNNIRNAWNSYTNGNEPDVTTASGQTYELVHPSEYDIYTANDKNALKNLVDDYYDADNASAVNSVFEEIVADIAISAPQVPTEIKGTDPMTDGYITYTDPIGDYMEVKDVKAIIYAGQTFTVKSVATVEGTTTYTFQGEVNSPVYGDQEIKNIIITVTEVNGKQTLVVKFPAAVIPLRVNSVELNPDGSVKTHTNNGAFPARVIYSVGLQSEIVKETADGDVYIDSSKISAEYLAKNLNADGTINFYSNVYTNSYTVNNSTAGDAIVEFEPAHNNGFYYILEPMPIYKDAEFKEQVKANEGLADDTIYYYEDIYYHGTAVEVDAVQRTGTQLKRTEVITGNDGYLYRAVGSPRLNRILRFEGTKVRNATGTAEDFYAPTFQNADGSTDPYEGRFVIYQGNNGRLSVVAGGNLQISKTVNAGNGLVAPDKEFAFTLSLESQELNFAHGYNYVITNEEGSEVASGTIAQNNAVIGLKDGQTATIFGLPPETEYTVTEAAEEGFTTEAEGDTGVITFGNTSFASFINTYNVKPVVWPANGTLKGTKELKGREWDDNDSFTFFISPYNNAPLPVDYDAQAGVTVNKPDSENGQIATFDFGAIEFTAPGFYRYTIMEKEPENDGYLPGMSYSRALYRMAVTVEDNGDGELVVTSSDIQRLYDDNANALFSYNNGEIVMNSGEEAQDAINFTNTYSVDEVVRVPVALKDYTDNSGENPLVSGMFEFKLEAIGVVENGEVVANSVSKVPMPQGSVNGAITTKNEGHNVTFPHVTFSQNLIPDNQDTITFRYQMSEVIPSSPVNGMTYDNTIYAIDVIVSVDAESHLLNVSAIYPNDERIVTFRNEYTPNPITADINGNKTLIGRDMKTGETFTFNIAGANAATNNAVRNGVVVIPSDLATVTGAKDGVASSFAFQNIVFKQAGTYRFIVSETKGTEASVEYDDSVVIVTVIVDDAANDGDLEVVSITYNNGKSAAEFTNTYTSKFSGEPISLSGTKNLVGKSLLDGEFFFNVVEYFNGQKVSEGLVSHTADTNADAKGVYTGAIDFVKGKTYNEAGTYEYYINEQIPNPKVGGTTYDESKFRFTVVVEDDLSGNLTVTSTTLEKASGSSWVEADEVVFNNTYLPNSATATLPLINKVIDGDRSEPLKAGEFEFKIKVVSADPADGIILPSTTVVSNAANGNIIFDKITFTKAGTYVVAMEEVIPEDADKVAGITYSTQTITAVYTVHDDRIGNLTATLTRFVGGEIITNTYKADPADVTIDITKTFTGRNNDEWLATDKFSFEVKVTDDATLSAIEAGDLEFAFDANSTDTATYTISSKGEIASASVKVNKPGTYKFTVSEVEGAIKGVAYDKSEKQVVIVATDDSANAQIKVKVNDLDTNKATLNFVNTYKASATYPVTITAKKKVTPSEGNSFTLKGGEFKFVIEGLDGAPTPASTTVTNDADGNVVFGAITYNKVGTYKYTVSEVKENLGGFTYDSAKFTVTVVVTDDASDAKLKASVEITDANNNEADIIFDNKYVPSEVQADIFGIKILDSEHKQIEAGEFEFAIEAITAGAPLPSVTTVTNAADGTFRFNAITYTKVGTYEYKVTEKNLGKDGYTYDIAEYTVIVKVTDEGKGKLSAEVQGVGDSQTPSIKFVNKYAPEAVDVVLGANSELAKELVGRELKENEFVFALLDDANTELLTAKNDANGNFKFALNFAKAGTYNYTIVEKNNNLPGVTYDQKVYGVKIVISDKAGHLAVDSVTYTLANDNVNKVVFSNTYKADDVNFTFNATKLLTGRDLIDGEFTFLLKYEDGTVISTATNTADGKIVFEAITFAETGTYKFFITEQAGDLANMTYDNAEYVVEIQVVDEGTGVLIVSTPVIKLAGSDETVSEVVFENTFTPPTVPESPKTGDIANFGLLIALLFISGGAVIGTSLYGKKKRETK